MPDPVYRLRRDRARWLEPGVLLQLPDQPGVFVHVAHVQEYHSLPNLVAVTVLEADGVAKRIELATTAWVLFLVPDDDPATHRWVKSGWTHPTEETP